MAVFGKGVKRRPSWLNCYHSVCVCVCSFRIVQFLSRIHCRILSKSSKHEQLLQFKYRFLFYAVQIQRENKKWIHFSGFNSMVSVFPYFEIGNTDFFFRFVRSVFTIFTTAVLIRVTFQWIDIAFIRKPYST